MVSQSAIHRDTEMSKSTKLFVVRPGFWVHDVKPEPVGPGTVLALTEDQAATCAHQIEAAPAKAKDGDVIAATADAAADPAPAE